MRYYGEFLSFYMIPQAKYINEINSSITSLLNYTDLIVFLDIIALIILCGYLFRNKKGSNRSNVIEEGLQKLQLSDSILKYDILGK